MPHKALSLILLGLTVLSLSAHSQTLYWVGGSGQWEDASSWATAPDASGGAGIPTPETAVVIPSASHPTHVSIHSVGQCAELEIAVGVTLEVNGTLVATAIQGIPQLHNFGSVVFLTTPPANQRAALAATGNWFGPEALAPIQAVSLVNTDCATSGANPYNIDVQVLSDYNGQAISCNTASDGSLTVNVTGGVGPFSFQWVGGALPPTFTQTITGLPAGTYTVLVTDLGQGTICSETIILNSPPAITLLDFTPSPPSCATNCDGSAAVIAIGGTGTLSYDWSNGESGQVATMLCNGDNSLEVTDANGCLYTANIPLALDTLWANITIEHILCGGEADGGATSNPLGGDGGPYTITWSSGDSGPVMSDELAGIYTATILDGSGCQIDSTFEITEQPPMVLTLDNTVEPSCGGALDGSISVSISGGLPPYDTDWVGPVPFTSTDEDLSGIGAGDYTLTVTDSNGCEQSLLVTFTEPLGVDATADLTPVSCALGADGAIDLHPVGGTAPYDFDWTGPPPFTSTDEDISGLVEGTYIVEITDDTGCTGIFSFDIIAPDPLLISVVVTPITCGGADDGAIDLTIAGGTPFYGILWDLNGSGTTTDEDLNDLGPGTYEVTVTDDAGCQETLTVDLTDPPVMLLTAVVTPVSCFGDADGAIDLTIVGGTPPVDVIWTGPAAFSSTNEDIAGLEPGTYTVDATDDAGCTATLDVEVLEPNELLATLTAAPLSCAGALDGAIDLEVNGGTAPYDIAWTGPNAFTSTSEDLAGLEAGIYQVTITDDADCQIVESVEVTEPPALDVTADITDVECAGDDSGAIDLTVSGGTPDYSFDWTLEGGGTASTEDLTDLPAGDYEVTITDDAGCQVVISYTIDENPPFDVVPTITPLSCAGAADGAIDLVITGGTPPFVVTWSGPGTYSGSGLSIADLEAGTYDADIEDDLGCTQSISQVVDEPEAIQLAGDVTDTSCGNTADGAIDLTVTGGVPTLDFDWTGPAAYTANTEDISGLEAGTYDITVTDDDGCQQTASFEVLPASVLDITSVVTNVSCFGEMDGAIDLTIAGGNPPIDVLWTFPDLSTTTTEDLSDLGPGTYLVTVSDADGCAVDLTFDITEPDEVTLDGVITQISCFGANDGAVDLTITGLAPPYVILWTGPGVFAGSEDISDLGPGTYTVTIIPLNGCQVTADFVLIEPLEITLIPTPTHLSCAGAADGAIELSILGGTPDYDTDWTGPNGFTSTDEDLSDLEAGTYTVVVTDLAGCSTTLDVEITEPAPLDTTVDVTDIACFGPLSGEIDLTVTGGQGPYNVTWTFPDLSTVVSEDLTGLAAGEYAAEVIDDLGCVVNLTATVNENPPFDVTPTIVDATCAGLDDGSISLLVTGGVDPYDIVWSTTDTGPVLSDLAAGMYDVTITDDTGCLFEIFGLTVGEAEPLVVDTQVLPVSCTDANNGEVHVTSITGGTPDYGVAWTGPNGYTSTDLVNTGLEPGTYSLTITDDNGCTYTQDLEVEDAPTIVIDASVDDPTCGGSSTITLTLSGGSWPLDGGGNDIINWQIDWTADNGFTLSEMTDTPTVLTDLEAGIYSVTVTDANACSASADYSILDEQALDVQSVAVQPGCDADDGSIELVVNGGTEPYIINWTADNGYVGTGAAIFDLAPGTYTVDLVDDLGCTYTEAFVLIAPPAIDYTLDTVQPMCAGDDDGSIDLTITDGTPPYTVLWVGPDGFSSPAEDISGLAAGTYTLDILDGSGCSITATIDLDEASPMNIIGNVTHLECAGSASGEIDITVIGGTPDYTFAWTALPTFTSSDGDLTDLEAATYELEVTDDNGCVALYSAEVTENPAITLTALDGEATCGLSDGSVSASATGGVEPYEYAWTNALGDPVGTGETVNDLPSGTYTVTLTDDADCQEVATVSISDTDGPQLDATFTSPLCADDFNGTIDLSPTGADPFEFAWTGPNAFTAITEDLADLEAGTYAVEVTDVNGCMASLSVDLTAPEALSASAIVTDVACGISGTGTIDLTVAGGTLDYSFSWTGPDSFIADTEDIADLNIGVYQVLITDAHFCTLTLEVTVDESPVLDLSADITHVACFGDDSGSIDLIFNSGTPNYDVVWNGPEAFASTSEDLTDLAPGMYTASVMDANGCAAELTVEVTEAAELTLAIDETPPTCLLENGSLLATASGGTVVGDYSYFWYDLDNGNALVGTAALLENIGSGNYGLEVTDDNGCLVTTTVALSDAGATLTAVAQDVLCFGDATGTLDLTVDGGAEPFDYDWNGPDGYTSNDEDLTDLAAGIYTVEVTDDNGCFYGEAFEIGSPDSLAVDLIAGNVLCATDINGTIITTVSGGTDPYTFSWVGPDGYTDSAQNLADLAPGCYDVLVTDAFNCTATAQACIEAPDSLEIVFSVDHIVCFGDSSGAIEADVLGGVGGYTWAWTGPGDFSSDQDTLTNLVAGNYVLQITDLNLCALDTTITVLENDSLGLTAVVTSPACIGNANGTIDATLTGGTPDYTIEWTGDAYTADTEDIADLAAGWYVYAITDSEGCVKVDSVEVLDPEGLEADIVATGVLCFGDNNGTLDLTPTGGTNPYSFAWTGPNGFTADTEDISDLEPGTYEVTFTDLFGCSGVLSAEVIEPDELVLTLLGSTDASCPESFDGSTQLDIAGGTEDYTILWSNGDFESGAQNPDDLPPGEYTVSVVDANGCSAELLDIEIGTLGAVVANAGEDFTDCQENGTWTLSGSNTGGSSEGWYDIDGILLTDNATLEVGTEPGTYQFIYQATDGICADSDTVEVVILPSPLADAGEDLDIFLDEQVELGGNPSVDESSVWDWSPGIMLDDSTSANPITLPLFEASTFYLDVIGENGCMASDTININLVPLLDVPSGFSPNGDQMNDVWELGYLSFYPNVVVQIFNRWGEMLYESEEGYNTPWDGTYNGKPLPIGTYYYVIRVNEPEFPEPLSGPLTILR